jgi:hypothetical protein
MLKGNIDATPPAISGTGRNIIMQFSLLGSVAFKLPFGLFDILKIARKQTWRRLNRKYICIRMYRAANDVTMLRKSKPAFSVVLSQRMCNTIMCKRSAGPEITMAAMKPEVVLSQERHEM